jgi:hypothetical protein
LPCPPRIYRITGVSPRRHAALRDFAGALAWTRIRGYISTVRKHGDDVLTALHDAITGNPWTPPQPA